MAVAGCLLLEYGVSGAAVAVGWSQYLNQLLDNLFGFQIPEALSQAPEQGGIVNLPAVILIVLCALLLIRGASESATVNTVMVLIKIGVLIMFIAIGITGWNSDNLADFAPFGFSGITAAAGIIFFSYIGLDAVSTAGEEVKDPHKTMPRAIIIALVTVTALYVDGAAWSPSPRSRTRSSRARRRACRRSWRTSPDRRWPGTVLAAGAVISIFSVTLVVIYGQTRILFAMARDGMIPELFHKVNPRDQDTGAEHDHRGHRHRAARRLHPDRLPGRDDQRRHPGRVHCGLDRGHGAALPAARAAPRTFKVPGFPVTPILAVLGCLWIIKDLRPVTLLVFLIWTAVVLVWYFTYGLKHSHLGRHEHVGLLTIPPGPTRRDPERDRTPCMTSTRPPNRWCAACSPTPRTGCGWTRCRWTRAPGPRPTSTTCSTASSGTAGRSPDEVLGVYSSVIAPSIISADSPRFLGFIPAAPTKASLLFDMLVSCASIQGISWLEASGAIAAENTVLRLIADEAGHAGRARAAASSPAGRPATCRRSRWPGRPARSGSASAAPAAGCGSWSGPTRTPRS